MLQLTGVAIILLLAALTALGPLAVDMYLPAMPAMAASLGATAGEMQLTLSIYMVGFACMQLVCGPLADRFGRKPVLIAGLSLFLGASVLCAVADSIQVLLAGRFLQALGGATGPVLGRAMVRDIYPSKDASRVLAYMASAMALAPAAAPLVGGLLLTALSWEAIFVFLAAYAVLIIGITVLALPEPLPVTRRQSLQPRVIAGNFRMLLRHRAFMGHTLTNASAFSGLFAFLSGSPFVLIEFLGVAPTHYGWYFALVVGGFIAGTLLTARLSSLGTHTLVRVGVTLCVAGGGLMAGLAWMEVYHVLAVIPPHMVFMMGVGVLMPQTMAGAITPFPHCAGSASSLFGFIQMTTAALVGAGVGQLHDGTSRTMATAIALAGGAALLSYWLLVRRRSVAVAEERPQTR